MAVLVCLAEARGEVVTKQQLLDEVWGQAAVTEDVLTQSVVELRKAFGDRAKNARVIETIRRVGFRLLVPVRAPGDVPEIPSAENVGERSWWRDTRPWLALAVVATLAIVFVLVRPDAVPPASAIDSLAVLPFANLSNDPELEYFSDGLSEELLNRIANITALKVPARTSAFAFKGRNVDVREIGRQLDVDSVLEGSVRRSRERVRITVQLVDVRNGYHVWSKTYDRPLSDVFATQDEIAQSIAEALNVPLTDAERNELSRPAPRSLDAYDHYMLGEVYFREKKDFGASDDWLERARASYRRSIELDPEYAPAWVGLAKSWLPLLWSRRADAFDDSMSEAQRAVDEALRLDPTLPEAYVSLAWIRNNRFDYVGVATAARKALAINPNDIAAMYYLALAEENQGHFATAATLYRRRMELDPLNLEVVESTVERLANLGYLDEALSRVERIRAGGADVAGLTAAIVIDYGRIDQAVRWALDNDRGLFQAAQLARAWSILGEDALAEAWLDEARRRRSFGYIVALPDVLVRLGLFEELAAVSRQAMETQAMPRNRMLSPAQFQLLTTSAIAQTLMGELVEARRYWEWRMEYGQVRLPARPAEHVTALTFYAWVCREMGDAQRAEALAGQARVVAAEARKQGVTGYPPLTVALARLEAFGGHNRAALEALHTAVDQGWRDFYAEVRLPMWGELARDPEYRTMLDGVKADLNAMRNALEREGLNQAPEGPE
jgi:TolB-like protein